MMSFKRKKLKMEKEKKERKVIRENNVTCSEKNREELKCFAYDFDFD